jgi:hypothetical protein
MCCTRNGLRALHHRSSGCRGLFSGLFLTPGAVETITCRTSDWAGVVDISSHRPLQFVSDALAKLPPTVTESSGEQTSTRPGSSDHWRPVHPLRVDPADRSHPHGRGARTSTFASSYHTYCIKATRRRQGFHCFFKGIGYRRDEEDGIVQHLPTTGRLQTHERGQLRCELSRLQRESMFDILRDASLRRNGKQPTPYPCQALGNQRHAGSRANIRWIHRRRLQSRLTTRLAALQGGKATVTAPSRWWIGGRGVPCSYRTAHTPNSKRCNRCKGSVVLQQDLPEIIGQVTSPLEPYVN